MDNETRHIFVSFKTTLQFVMWLNYYHNDVITWNSFSYHWPFVRKSDSQRWLPFPEGQLCKPLIFLWYPGYCWTYSRLAGIRKTMVLMWRHCNDNIKTLPKKYTPYSELAVIFGKFYYIHEQRHRFRYNYLWSVITTGVIFHQANLLIRTFPSSKYRPNLLNIVMSFLHC